MDLPFGVECGLQPAIFQFAFHEITPVGAVLVQIFGGLVQIPAGAIAQSTDVLELLLVVDQKPTLALRDMYHTVPAEVLRQENWVLGLPRDRRHGIGIAVRGPPRPAQTVRVYCRSTRWARRPWKAVPALPTSPGPRTGSPSDGPCTFRKRLSPSRWLPTVPTCFCQGTTGFEPNLREVLTVQANRN